MYATFHYVVKCRGEQHQHNEQRIDPTVEHIADQRQQQVPVAVRHRVVQQQRKRQKIKNEDMGAEDHDVCTAQAPRWIGELYHLFFDRKWVDRPPSGGRVG